LVLVFFSRVRVVFPASSRKCEGILRSTLNLIILSLSVSCLVHSQADNPLGLLLAELGTGVGSGEKWLGRNLCRSSVTSNMMLHFLWLMVE
jgi:hypothetical protein